MFFQTLDLRRRRQQTFVKREVKNDHLHFGHYLDVLHSFKSYVCKQNLISSTNHTVRTVHTRKVGFTAFGTKRWLCEDTVHTHSHGHKDTVSDLINKSCFGMCFDKCEASLATMICLEHHHWLSGSSLICFMGLFLIFRAPR